MIRNDEQREMPVEGTLIPARQRPMGMVIPAGALGDMNGSANGAPHLDGYLHALRRNWFWCVLLGGILAGAAGASVWWFVPDGTRQWRN